MGHSKFKMRLLPIFFVAAITAAPLAPAEDSSSSKHLQKRWWRNIFGNEMPVERSIDRRGWNPLKTIRDSIKNEIQKAHAKAAGKYIKDLLKHHQEKIMDSLK